MIRFRYYIDNDKETKWLNKMSDKGYKMVGFFLGCYSFVPCEKGEYEYKIDLLENNGQDHDYIEFLEETGVEYICRWYRWVWLCKKKSDTPFELFSDAESKISYYSRIQSFFFAIGVLELFCAVMQLPGSLMGRIPSMIACVLTGGLSVTLFRLSLKMREKIRKLK